MISNLPKYIITSFLAICVSTLHAEDDEIPILLRVSGNQSKTIAPGDTVNIYVTAVSELKGSFSLEIKPELPSFATNWDTKRIVCKSECSLTDTLTLAPTSADCGKYSFTINAQLFGSEDFAEVHHTVNIEVAPKMIDEPPFTTGVSNSICWDGCDDLQEELMFFPEPSKKFDGLSLLKAATSDHVRCEVVEGLAEGIKYGYYVQSTVLRDGEFMSLRSDTTFSTQDNSPPPAVSLQEFTVSPVGHVGLRWPHLPDEIGYVEQYVLHRRNIHESAFAVVDTIPFFPAKVLSPQNYFPVGAERNGVLYQDRDEIITKLPDAVKGSTMIRTAVADRWDESASFLTFQLESPAEVYVAVDRRGEGIPDWLDLDYRTINKDILTDAGTKLRIFKSRRVFPAGEVVLGGNFAAGVDLAHREPFMYAVFIQPVERVFPYQQGEFITYTDPVGEENDLETFNYQIEAIDAAGNVSAGVTSGPVIIDLHGHCKPIITDWFIAEGPTGQEFSRGTTNRICIQDPNTIAQCLGFRDSDSLRFQAARGNAGLLGTQTPGDEEGFFFDSGWIDVRDLKQAFCYDFELLPPGRDANFVNGQKYFYRVRAKDVHGNLGVWSDTVSAIQDFFPPTDISTLSATTEVFASGDDGCVRLNWGPAVDQVSGVGSYVIYRRDDSGAPFSAIDEIDGVLTTYCDTLSQIVENNIFTYKVLARDRVGNSISLEESSQEVSLRALVAPRIEPDIPQIFDCPSGLIGVNRDTVGIKWQDFDATDLLRYEARIVGPANFELSKLIEDPTATRTDCPIAGEDGVYEIRLRAFYNDGSVTIFSNAVVVRKKTQLQGVDSLIAEQEGGSTGNILLSWSHPDQDEIVEFQIFTWPDGAAQPDEPFITLPGDSFQWVHSFERDGIAAYQCNNYLVRVRDCFDLVSTTNPIVNQFSNRAPIFDRTQVEMTGNDITVCWQRPSPRVKEDDSFVAQILVYQDSVTAVPFHTGDVFNNTCFTFFDAPPMHNYIFQVKETILDDLGQSCSDSFMSSLSEPMIVPLDNLPPSVRFDAQALPVLPGETQGRAFLSWQEYESDVVEDFVVQWTGIGAATSSDSLLVTGADTVLISGLDLTTDYEFTVVAIDFLGQRSVDNDRKTLSFVPPWVFTPKPRRLNPGCFRDSVTVEWDWVDEDLNPVAGRLGADSVFVEFSIDSTFRFIKASKHAREGNSITFHREQDYPFVNRQNDRVFARVRAKDRFNHISPWSTTYPELGLVAGTFDDSPPDVVTCFVDSTKAPDFGGENRVNVHLSWADASDNCSGAWFYEISRNQTVIARDTSRNETHFFVDRGLLFDEDFQDNEWTVHAIDSAGNRQETAIGSRVPIGISPPDSAGCADDTTFCWNSATVNVSGLEVTYFIEGARFEELIGNPTTNVLAGPLTSQCFAFSVPWEGIHWRVKAKVGNFESPWSQIFFCPLSPQSQITSVDPRRSASIPESFALRQNYPNPFNPATTIEYAVPRTDGNQVRVLLDLYNVTGQKIRTLVHENRQPGEYAVVWDGLDDRGRFVGSGVYIYQMRTKEFVASQKLILLK